MEPSQVKEMGVSLTDAMQKQESGTRGVLAVLKSISVVTAEV